MSTDKQTKELEGKIIVITGANTGIGYETALDLARRGGHIILACRDQVRADEAARKIKEETKNDQVVVMLVDLGHLESVHNFAKAFKEKFEKLDILINNAGLASFSPMKTKDGFEVHFGVNHLGHFLLTNLLLDLIKKSAPSRIINVSSEACKMGSIHWDDIHFEKSKEYFGPYAQSKLANVLFTIELADRLKDSGVTVVSLHPGFVKTEIGRNQNGFLGMILKPIVFLFAKNSTQGAMTTIHCAINKDVPNHSGRYFNNSKVENLSPKIENKEDAKRLWDLSYKMVAHEE